MHLSGTIGIHVPQNIGVGTKIMFLSVLEKKVIAKNMHFINLLPAILKECQNTISQWLIFGVIKHNKEPGTKIGLLWKMSGSFTNSTGLKVL
jgi:hypothetical protein